MTVNRMLVLFLIVLALVACGQENTPTPTAPPPPTQAAEPTAEATAPPATVAPPSAAAATDTAVAPTSAPPTTAPAAGNLPGGDLSEAEMAQIFRNSFAAYPWRMEESVTSKADGKTITGLVEAQSSERVHLLSNQTIGADTVILESILITPTLYMKGTGGNPLLYQQFGATEGQWLKVPPDSPLAGFAEMAYLAANPVQLLERIGFQQLLQQLNPSQKSYKLVGSEPVAGTPANLYELALGSGNSALTYRVWIGTSDGRIHKLTSDNPNTTTNITVTYDPSINIQPPIP